MSEAVRKTFKYTFVFAFGITFFLELFLGVPGAVFVIFPYIADNFLDVGLIEWSLVLILSLCLIATIVLAFKLVNYDEIDFKSFVSNNDTFSCERLITYDFLTSFAIILMSIIYIMHPTEMPYLLKPAGKRLFNMSMEAYEHNQCWRHRWPNSTAWSNHYVDTVQQTYRCCGWKSPYDWKHFAANVTRHRLIAYHRTLPLSCCPMNQNQPCQTCSLFRQDIYWKGCANAVGHMINSHNPISYGFGFFYYILKATAYFTYTIGFKEAIEEGNFLFGLSID